MTKNRATILITEDEIHIREALIMALKDKYNLITAKNGTESISTISNESVDLVLLDFIMPEMNGLEVLEQIKAIDDTIPVIMVTAVKTVGTAVSVMKKGAYDYITKPFDIKKLEALIEKALEQRLLQKENTYLKAQFEKKLGFEKIIGKSHKIKDVFEIIEKVAPSNSTVLIHGESGTGKELVARAIHNRSSRKKKLFVAINCAAIPENLLESELFGHERGAFTGAVDKRMGKFELAHKGTIFLDEISSMPMAMQAKLLRVLQDKVVEHVGSNKGFTIDVRVIAATNTDLKEEIKCNRFREDLYYRLNVIPISIPPLRERKEDIPLLIKYFMNKYNLEFGKDIKRFTDEANKLLLNYAWPGNVRELENLIERLIVLGKDDKISANKLPLEISKIHQISHSKSFSESINETSKKLEAGFIKYIIRKSNLNNRQLKAINHVKKEGKITKEKYIKLNNTTKTTAFRDLSNLSKLNIFVTNGTGKNTFYTLAE